MAASPRSAQGPEASSGSARSRRERVRTGALVVLAVLITLFAVFNTAEVKVNWVFGSGKAPLIIVIVISLLVGIALTYFAEHRFGRRRRERGQRRDFTDA
ncbi:MAG TPA: lipopolysaccharide assembly protein LapA domain-containing protein [Solirubrobacteraceae bacterium]